MLPAIVEKDGSKIDSTRKSLNFVDGMVDAFYLNASLLNNAQGISGNNADEGVWSSNDSLIGLYVSSVVVFFLVGAAKGYSNAFRRNWNVDEDKIKSNYDYARDIFSSLKNGRNASVNLINLHGILSSQSISSVIYSASGGVAFGVGALLVVSNLYKRKLLKEREKRGALLGSLLSTGLSSAQPELHELKFKLSQELLNKKDNTLMLTVFFDSIVDGLYQVGNVYMLLMLVGVSVSGPVGWALAAAYVTYTAMLTFSNCFREHLDQLNESIEIEKALADLGDPDKLALLTLKKTELEKTYSYYVYNNMHWTLNIIRKNVNYCKNSLYAAAGLNLLRFNGSLTDSKGNVAVMAIGFSIALMMSVKSVLNKNYHKFSSFKTLFRAPPPPAPAPPASPAPPAPAPAPPALA